MILIWPTLFAETLRSVELGTLHWLVKFENVEFCWTDAEGLLHRKPLFLTFLSTWRWLVWNFDRKSSVFFHQRSRDSYRGCLWSITHCNNVNKPEIREPDYSKQILTCKLMCKNSCRTVWRVSTLLKCFLNMSWQFSQIFRAVFVRRKSTKVKIRPQTASNLQNFWVRSFQNSSTYTIMTFFFLKMAQVHLQVPGRLRIHHGCLNLNFLGQYLTPRVMQAPIWSFEGLLMYRNLSIVFKLGEIHDLVVF